jgi:hypothetical protein
MAPRKETPMCCLRQIKEYTEKIAMWLDTDKESALEFIFSEEYNLECVKELLDETLFGVLQTIS